MIGLAFLTRNLSLAAVFSRVLLLSIKRLSFSPVSSWFLVFAVSLLLVLFVVRFYARNDTRLSTRRRQLLLGLRIAAFMCVLVALLQPVVSLESRESRRPRVFVLVDGSASMKLPFDLAATGDSSRSRADVAFGVAQGLLKKLPRRFDSSLFVFSDSLRRVDLKRDVLDLKPGDATGSRTALGQALEDISSRVGKTPSAVVVISDGATTFGPDPTGVAKRISFPVYTVLAAHEGSFRDIEITEVLHPASGYAGSEVPVLVRVKGHGLENLDVPLSVFEGETVVSRGMLTLAGAAEAEILLSVKPALAGLHFYRVSIPVVKGEVSAVNNTASFAVRVLSEKQEILFLEGDLTWDFTFLKRQLESDPRLETTFALVSGGKTTLPTIEGFVQSVPVGVGRSEVVFIGDGAARYLGRETWRRLENFVGSGGGLFIAGAEGLNEMPASARKLLPVRLRPPDTWGPREYLDCRVTLDGLDHPICDVETDAVSNADSWKGISPLLGSHVVDSANPGASVLVEAGTRDKSFPVIVAGSYGRGRVVLIAASGFWRWGFSLPGVGGSDRLFSGFTSNAVWWLSEAEKDKSPDITPQSWVFENGEDVIFSGKGVSELPGGGGILNKAGGDSSARRVSATGGMSNPRLEVIDKHGKTLAPVFTQNTGPDSLVLNFGILEPGAYTYKVSYAGNGEGTAPGGNFLVDANGPEYRNLLPDSRLLTYVSEASGGKSFTSDQVGALARDVQTYGEKAAVERQVKLWNHPVLFLCFTVLVAIEWWLRRRSGLP